MQVHLPASLKRVGDSAFSGCVAIPDPVLPDGLIELGRSAFYNCQGLTRVTIPGSVTNVGGWAFGGCEGLTQLTLPTSLTDLGGYNELFPSCPNLESFLVDPDHEAYGSFEGMLTDREGTILLRCPAGRTGKVAIPEGISWIESGALDGCARITEPVIPESLAGCSAPGGEEISGVQYWAYPLSSWTSLQAIQVDDHNPVCRSLDGALFDQSGSQIVRCPAGRSGAYRVPDGVREVLNSAFAGSRNLTRMIIPESVTTVGLGAFHDCPRLAAAFFEGDEPFSPCAMFPPAFVEPTLIYHLPEMAGFGEDEDWSTCLYPHWARETLDGTVTRLWTPEVAEGEGGLRLEDGSLAFTVFWARHREVVVEFSPSLSPPEWTAIATLTVGNDNFVRFRDPQPARADRRVYRLMGR